ncbi:52 kDa repressor of the inhibitor of the protein kinase-like [Xylocopa sonorina]|uniref:52 kDa repressor of the inhibitor of the protein kinase-like n=1 Tax=Xylocopa sonorina TaxID=1818115 RepID=UPI00403B3707
MNTKGMSSCAMLGCVHVLDVERHFFRFPKEHDRWLKWVEACKRFDLLRKGPEYSYRNIRLCHLHFEEKLYKIHKCRAHLHPDAVPTLLLGPDPNQDFVS